MNRRVSNERNEPIAQILGPRLLPWYDAHARDLPWRKDSDPYRVWVSEIMLQQTRVAAVLEHYREFLQRFPTVEKLARAREASILAAWSGLGYYRRARMLHAAAKAIVRELLGEFPATSDEWRALPGIGRYTAAAIASIAFGEPVAVVDGNVERVLQRVLGKRLAEKKVWESATGMLDRARPGDFNQAMMELGATVCTPRSPACLTCPVVEVCATRGELAGGTQAAPQKKQEIHHALDCRDGKVFLTQRPGDAALMAGMWELPQIPSATISPSRGQRSRDGMKTRRLDSVEKTKPFFKVRHSITVTDYMVHVWCMPATPGVPGKWIPVRQLSRIALTGLARKVLRKARII